VTELGEATYVAVGASETVGVGADRPALEAWPEVLRRQVLRPDMGYVNVGVSGTTVAQAVQSQLPRALAARPALATVWLNVNDIVRLVLVRRYEQDLRTIVRALRDLGAEVLVANTPPVEDFPVVQACLPNPPPGLRCPLPIRLPGPEPLIQFVEQYDAAVARVADDEGAVLVDLHSAAVTRRSGGLRSFFARDGFHPSTTGHEAIAEIFGSTLRSDPRTAVFANDGA
jgi:acyl-CoA thioesterase-1